MRALLDDSTLYCTVWFLWSRTMAYERRCRELIARTLYNNSKVTVADADVIVKIKK